MVSSSASAPVDLGPVRWAGFRGPHRDGKAPGIVLKSDWKAEPPRTLWTKAVGPGWSSFAVQGNRLFTQEQRGEKEAIVARDAETGDVCWLVESPVRFDEALGGPGPRFAALCQSIDEMRHTQTEVHTLSNYNKYYSGFHNFSQQHDRVWYLSVTKSFFEDALSAGPFEFLIAIGFSFEYLLTNLLFVPFMSGASFNGDLPTMTFGFSAQSDESRHMTLGLEAIKFLLEQDEAHVRSLIVAALTRPELRLRSLHSHDADVRGQVEVHAMVDSLKRDEGLFERATSRLSLEPSVTSVTWTVEGDDDDEDDS